MTTAVLVRVCLDFHRQQGVPFQTAWARAMQSIPRGSAVESDRVEWVAALRWARPAFRAAYEREDLGVALTSADAYWQGTPDDLRAVAAPERVAA